MLNVCTAGSEAEITRDRLNDWPAV